VHLPTPHLLPPPASPSAKNGKEGAAAATPARPQLRLSGLVRTPSQGSLATKSPTPSPSPTPPSPLTPAPAGNSNNKSGQSTPKQRAENLKPPVSPATTAPAIPVPHFVDHDDEAGTSPLRLGKSQLDHLQQQRQQHAPENGGSVPPDVAAVAAVGERRALSVTLRLATAAISLAAFAVIVSARTSGWAGDSYARHQQYRSVIVTCSHVPSRPGFFFAGFVGRVRFLTVTGVVARTRIFFFLNNKEENKRKSN
jgi:hypothetical protein